MVKYKITEKNFQSLTEKSHALREKCPYSELFWSIFSRIRTMWKNTDQNNSEYEHSLRNDSDVEMTK